MFLISTLVHDIIRMTQNEISCQKRSCRCLWFLIFVIVGNTQYTKNSRCNGENTLITHYASHLFKSAFANLFNTKIQLRKGLKYSSSSSGSPHSLNLLNCFNLLCSTDSSQCRFFG